MIQSPRTHRVQPLQLVFRPCSIEKHPSSGVANRYTPLFDAARQTLWPSFSLADCFDAFLQMPQSSGRLTKFREPPLMRHFEFTNWGRLHQQPTGKSACLSSMLSCHSRHHRNIDTHTHADAQIQVAGWSLGTVQASQDHPTVQGFMFVFVTSMSNN